MSCASSTTAKSKIGFLVLDIAAARQLNTSAYLIRLNSDKGMLARKRAYYEALRAAARELTDIATGKEPRPPPSDCRAIRSFE